MVILWSEAELPQEIQQYMEWKITWSKLVILCGGKCTSMGAKVLWLGQNVHNIRAIVSFWVGANVLGSVCGCGTTVTVGRTSVVFCLFACIIEINVVTPSGNAPMSSHFDRGFQVNVCPPKKVESQCIGEDSFLEHTLRTGTQISLTTRPD